MTHRRNPRFLRVAALALLPAALLSAAGCVPVTAGLSDARDAAGLLPAPKTVNVAVPAPPPPAGDFDVIAFGSCAHQDRPQPIWDAVLAQRPDLFVFLGDNIYGDTEDPAVLRAKYAQMAAKEGFQRLRTSTPVVATWDDHDYGANDAGAGFPAKDASRVAFLDFWGAPPDSPRRTQEGGIYAAYTYGQEGRRVQVILLDTRWNRTPLKRLSEAEVAERARRLVGPYAPVADPNAALLGDAQWRWLEEQLRQPAEVRLIATSIPALQMGTGFETWDNFPAERARLFDLIAATQAQGVLFITGDTHRAQFSRLDDGVPYSLWEMNSSGLTENYDRPAPDANRLGQPFTEDNFGLIRIDWSLPDPTLTLEIRAADNDLALQNTIRLSDLRQTTHNTDADARGFERMNADFTARLIRFYPCQSACIRVQAVQSVPRTTGGAVGPGLPPIGSGVTPSASRSLKGMGRWTSSTPSPASSTVK